MHWKDWCWSWNSNTLATWCEELTHLKRPWCWERLKVGGEGDDRGWDGWMASPTQCTWVWVNSGSWWWTGRPGLLQSMGSQRVRHIWATEQNWTEWSPCPPLYFWSLQALRPKKTCQVGNWRCSTKGEICLNLSLIAQLVNNLPAIQEILVWFLGWQDPLERDRLPTPVFWPKEFHGLYSPWGRKESDTTEQLSPSP